MNLNSLDIEKEIKDIKDNSKYSRPVFEYTHGKCYEFAKELRSRLGGEIVYLVNIEHALLKINNKLYDVTGNVSKVYIGEKEITEEDMLKKYKCFREV